MKKVDLKNETVADAKPIVPAVFLSGKDKVEQFQKEFKALLTFGKEINIKAIF